MRKICLLFSLFVVALSLNVHSEQLCLRFLYSIDDSNTTITPDIFLVVGDEELVTKGLDIKDLRKPPRPPAKDYVKIETTDTGTSLIKDYRPFDPNLPDMAFPIELSCYAEGTDGLTGSAVFTLTNPEGLSVFQPDTLVYLRRYDAPGNFLQKYDLTDPNNHSIEWPVTNVHGPHGRMELVIIDKCLASNLNGSGPVNFTDYSIMAKSWDKNGDIVTGDIDGDGSVDANDLSIMVEKWLFYCIP